VDPLAPFRPGYEQIEFERYQSAATVDAVVACNSLHHVKDPDVIVDTIASRLKRGGVLIVIEWARELFDEATANWCFDRLGPSDSAGWLHRRRADWRWSGRPWAQYLRDWGEQEGVHPAHQLVDLLNERFDRTTYRSGPRFFPELVDVSASDEQAAIDADEIRATRIDYVARAR
jgi:SAM-dependent methyltransferase